MSQIQLLESIWFKEIKKKRWSHVTYVHEVWLKILNNLKKEWIILDIWTFSVQTVIAHWRWKNRRTNTNMFRSKVAEVLVKLNQYWEDISPYLDKLDSL
jgi:hypothetical protein